METIGAGAVIADLNGDEHLDLYLVNGGDVDPSQAPAPLGGLFFGDGKGGLRRAPDSDATRKPIFGFGAAAADYDRDGDLDLVVCCLGPIVLLRNRGDGTFEDVTAAAGLNASGWWASACFGDVDGDGWLDLFVAAYFEFGSQASRSRTQCEWAGIKVACGPKGETPLPDVLYRNKGNGTFEDVSERSGILADSPRFGLAVTMADLDARPRPRHPRRERLDAEQPLGERRQGFVHRHRPEQGDRALGRGPCPGRYGARASRTSTATAGSTCS